MLGHKWRKTMTENSVDTYEKKFKKIQYLSNQISDCISLGDYEKVVMYDQKRKSLILEINSNNSDDFKALLYKETKNNQKMIETIVNNKNKIVKEVFKSNSVRKAYSKRQIKL